MTVYIEYVFIDNFVIDFMLLKATFALTGNRCGKGRLLFCSALGGIFALLYPLFSVHAVLLAVIKLAFGLLLLLLAGSYRSAKNFYINGAVFFGLTFLTGGAVIGVFSLLGLDYSAEYSVAIMFIPVYFAVKSLSAVVRYLYRRKDTAALIYDCEFSVGGVVISGKGFIDTGNGLYDGDSPVIICGKSFAQRFFRENFRLPELKYLEFSTVSGKDRMLSFKLDIFKIYIDGRENIFNNVTLCVAKAGTGVDYDVILHPSFKEIKDACNSQTKTEKVS